MLGGGLRAQDEDPFATFEGEGERWTIVRCRYVYLAVACKPGFDLAFHPELINRDKGIDE